MIIARTKWDTELHETAFGLLKQRVDEGFYYDNWDDGNPDHQWEDRAKAILATPIPRCLGPARDAAKAKAERAAWAFLSERKDHEYEYVEVTTVRP